MKMILSKPTFVVVGLLFTAALVAALFLSTGRVVKAQPVPQDASRAQTAAQEKQELDSILATTRATFNRIPRRANAPVLRRAVANELNSELETWVTNHLDSEW